MPRYLQVVWWVAVVYASAVFIGGIHHLWVDHLSKGVGLTIANCDGFDVRNASVQHARERIAGMVLQLAEKSS